MSLQMACYSAVFAEVSFSGEALSGHAPVNKVGALLLSEGIAIMSADSIEIQGKGPNGPKESQLQGRVFKTTHIANKIKGQVYFDGGVGLAFLDLNDCEEYVQMSDGTKVKGPITEVSNNAITCNRRSIPMNEVTEVHSGRVFKFTSVLGNSAEINFEPTCIKGLAFRKHKSEGPRSGAPTAAKVIVAGSTAAVITCAIVLPIVIPAAYNHYHNHQVNNRGYNNYLYNKLNSYLHQPSSSVLSTSTTVRIPRRRPPRNPPS